MKTTTELLLCLGVLAFVGPAFATTYVVRPDGTGDFPTIQAAINTVVDGDTIELTNGTFIGVGNRDIDYLGKAIVIQSQSGNPDSCIIDCQRAGRGFYFHSGEGAASVLEGVKIVNGRADDGGGVCCWDNSSPAFLNCTVSSSLAGRGGGIGCWFSSSPTLTNCRITGNSAGDGGGVYCWNNSSPTFANCTFSVNSATDHGGAIYCQSSRPSFTNCSLGGNSAVDLGGAACCRSSSPAFTNCALSGNAAFAGGGVWCEDSSPAFSNCTLDRNFADFGGGLWCEYSSPTLNSTIIAFSRGSGIQLVSSARSQVVYCDIFSNSGGAFAGDIPFGLGELADTNVNGDSCDSYFNIFLDPIFVDTASGDFHLVESSPCIDAGDPALPRDPDSTVADIGAFYYHQVDAESPIVLLPTVHVLHPNWPNPFNSTTRIRYDVPTSGPVRLTVFNLLGQAVIRLVDERQLPGAYTILWDAGHLPSGIYFCRMEAGEFVQTSKLVLMK